MNQPLAPMKTNIGIALILALFTGYSQCEEMTFSAYDKNLKITSINNTESIAKFYGKIRVTGVIYFEFDRDESGHNVDINSANFVPDTPSSKRLPAVVSGVHPGPIKYISLEPAEKAFYSVYGKKKSLELMKSGRPSVSQPVVVEFKQYVTSVDCDSRNYWSTSYSVKTLPNQVVVSNTEVHFGC